MAPFMPVGSFGKKVSGALQVAAAGVGMPHFASFCNTYGLVGSLGRLGNCRVCNDLRSRDGLCPPLLCCTCFFMLFKGPSPDRDRLKPAGVRPLNRPRVDARGAANQPYNGWPNGNQAA